MLYDCKVFCQAFASLTNESMFMTKIALLSAIIAAVYAVRMQDMDEKRAIDFVNCFNHIICKGKYYYKICHFMLINNLMIK